MRRNNNGRTSPALEHTMQLLEDHRQAEQRRHDSKQRIQEERLEQEKIRRSNEQKEKRRLQKAKEQSELKRKSPSLEEMSSYIDHAFKNEKKSTNKRRRVSSGNSATLPVTTVPSPYGPVILWQPPRIAKSPRVTPSPTNGIANHNQKRSAYAANNRSYPPLHNNRQVAAPPTFVTPPATAIVQTRRNHNVHYPASSRTFSSTATRSPAYYRKPAIQLTHFNHKPQADEKKKSDTGDSKNLGGYRR